MFKLGKALIEFVFGLVELLLVLRFVLEFFGANYRSPFVAWIYGASAVLLAPFGNILPSIHLGGFLIDLSVLLALIVYIFIGRLIMKVVS